MLQQKISPLLSITSPDPLETKLIARDQALDEARDYLDHALAFEDGTQRTIEHLALRRAKRLFAMTDSDEFPLLDYCDQIMAATTTLIGYTVRSELTLIQTIAISPDGDLLLSQGDREDPGRLYLPSPALHGYLRAYLQFAVERPKLRERLGETPRLMLQRLKAYCGCTEGGLDRSINLLARYINVFEPTGFRWQYLT